jgi:Fic-DOC domain mobile mystery protein B
MIEILEGETPIDDLSGLIPKFVSTRQDLINVETRNILEARYKYSLKNTFVYSNRFLMTMHRDMYNLVWKWAGKKRIFNLNIGVPHFNIDTEIKNLLDDLKCWEEVGEELFKIISFFHHRLTKIHPFQNGNGRWARFVVSYYSKVVHNVIITWPDLALVKNSDLRSKYILSLRNADDGDYNLLFSFHKEIL